MRNFASKYANKKLNLNKIKDMKRFILALTMLVAMVATASAQAEIKFDRVVHNFGNFSEKSPVQKTTFTFTNVGNKPLIINPSPVAAALFQPIPSSLSHQARKVRLL